MSDKINKLQSRLESLFYVLLVLGTVSLVYLGIKLLGMGNLNFGNISFEIIGVIGDFIGGFIGTIFTIATIILVWMTYQSQKQELSNTQDLIRNQNFDTSFFSLLEMLKSVIENMDLRIMKTVPTDKDGQQTKSAFSHEVHGRDCFINLSRTCIHKSASMTIPEAIERTYLDNESDLGPYLKMIKNIAKRIDQREDNVFYIETFNSSFSGYELVLINYFMHSNLLSNEDKLRLCRFETLHDLDVKKLGHPQHRFNCETLHNTVP